MTENKTVKTSDKQKKLVNVGILLIAAIVIAGYYFLDNSSSSSSNSFKPLEIGETGRIVSESGKTITLAISKESHKELLQAASAKDKPGFDQLLYAGKVFFVDSNTRVNVIDRAMYASCVRILEGPQKDKAGWCAYEY